RARAKPCWLVLWPAKRGYLFSAFPALTSSRCLLGRAREKDRCLSRGRACHYCGAGTRSRSGKQDLDHSQRRCRAGLSQQLPTEDRYLMTRSELLARIYVLLGGRVAEEMIFGDVSTGAQNDLQKATEIARTMITQFGMSDRLGLVALEAQ